jgi:hypothetical protein
METPLPLVIIFCSGVVDLRRSREHGAARSGRDRRARRVLLPERAQLVVQRLERLVPAAARLVGARLGRGRTGDLAREGRRLRERLRLLRERFEDAGHGRYGVWESVLGLGGAGLVGR